MIVKFLFSFSEDVLPRGLFAPPHRSQVKKETNNATRYGFYMQPHHSGTQ